jgi:hypothetical protein
MPGETSTARSTVALPGYSVTLWMGASVADAMGAMEANHAHRASVHPSLFAM